MSFKFVASIAAWVVVLVFGTHLVVGQAVPALAGSTPPSVAPGTPPGSYALSDLETVELYSGKVNFVVPIHDIDGRGSAGYRMTVPVQRGWTVVQIPNPHQSGTTWPYVVSMETPDVTYGSLPNEPDLAVEPYTPGYMTMRSYPYGTPVNCGAGNGPPTVIAATGGHTLTKVFFRTPDGTETEFVDQSTGGQPLAAPSPACNYTSSPNSRGTIFVAVDGSARTFIASAPVYDSTYAKAVGGLINGILFFPDGTRYDINSANNSNLPTGHVTGIYDTKGNYTQVNLDQNPCPTGNGCEADPNFQVTDPLARSTNVVLANVADSAVEDKISFPGAGGATRTAYVIYSQMGNALISTQTLANLNCLFPVSVLPSTAGAGQFDPWVISSIQLPNGQQYSFYYNSYGDVAKIVLPTGGAIEYDYPTITSGTCPTTDTTSGYSAASMTVQRRLQERRVYQDGVTLEQRTTYSYSIAQTPDIGQTTVTVTHIDPSTEAPLSIENHYYYGDPLLMAPVDPTTSTFWEESKEYETDLLNASGVILRTIVNAWQQRTCGQFSLDVACWFVNDSNYAYPSIANSATPQAPAHYPSLQSTTTTLADVTPNQVSGISYDSYDQYNNATSVTEYDYGAGAPGSKLRNTLTTYLTSGYDIVNSSAAASTIHIRRAPTDKQVYDGNANYVAETKYSYDQTAVTQESGSISGYVAPGSAQITACSGAATGSNCLGNLTTISQWSSTLGQFVPSTKTYDNLGNVMSVTDANGNQTNYSYADSFSTTTSLSGTNAYAFPTTVTNALSQQTTFQYDYYIGRPSQSKDPNSITTGVVYNDPLDRPTQVTHGTGAAQTTFAYVDTPNSVSVTTTSDQNTWNDNIIKTEVLYDGLARKQEARQYVNCPSGSSDEGYISVQQTYDVMSRPYTTTNPFRPCASESAENTTTAYDALNRPSTVTTADGSASTFSYSGNQTTTTDPAGVQRSSVTDAAGRVTSVTEAGSVLTSYSYNALNDLTQVCQGAAFSGGSCMASGAESRVFTYDSLGRLWTAQNPESGTTTYTYDKNGNLWTKTDANSNTATMSYDGLNRLTSKTYSPSTTPNVTYCYDGNTQGVCAGAPSGSGNYLIGHLTLLSSSLSGTPVSSTSYGQFDVFGNVLQSRQSDVPPGSVQHRNRI